MTIFFLPLFLLDKCSISNLSYQAEKVVLYYIIIRQVPQYMEDLCLVLSGITSSALL